MAIVSVPRTGESLDQSSSLGFAVLRDPEEILKATHDLQSRGLLEATAPIGGLERLRRRVLRHPDPARVAKTWDVHRTLAALTARLERSESVLDMGCFACDILPGLRRLDFQSLYGIDLNPSVRQMPYADAIHYTTGDLLATPWPDGQFAAVTAISVIEHGVPDEGLCREVSRLLRPGGVFIFTTDYWPQKIVTTERMFDLDWRIFDTAEIEALVDVAEAHDLHPTMDPRPAIRDVGTPAIHFAGKDYTFLYGTFIRGKG